jgi:hypothetical protein
MFGICCWIFLLNVRNLLLDLLLLNVWNLLLDLSAECSESAAGSSAECSESAAGSSLLNVRNLLLLLNVTENV